MLVACHTCHHQFDVGDLMPGSKFLCHCGLYVRVPKEVARDAVVAHCASCGAHLGADAKECGFCGSEVSAIDHQIGAMCPECYARLLKGASFCSSCGVALQAEVLHSGAPSKCKCPRCDEPLWRRKVTGGSFDECRKCGGVWIAQELFEQIVEEKDESAVVASTGKARSVDSSASFVEVDTVRYIPCPVCAELMHRKNFGRSSGVILDWCRGHGYWFDAFELERILDFINTGGLDRARKRGIDEQKRELQAQRDHRRSAYGPGETPVYGPAFGGGLTGSFLADDLIDGVIGFFDRLFRRR